MSEQKEATKFTAAANNALLTHLNWDDIQDFELATAASSPPKNCATVC